MLTTINLDNTAWPQYSGHKNKHCKHSIEINCSTTMSSIQNIAFSQFRQANIANISSISRSIV